MMDRPFAFHSREKRLQVVEQRLRQHHVDVQRLWKRVPQGPDLYGDPQSSTQVAQVFDDPLETGAPDAGTGGTKRCSQGFAFYEQCRWAGRARNLIGTANATNGTAWGNHAEAEGAPDGEGATCSLQIRKRSYFLTLDQFGFVIPPDAVIDNIKAHITYKLTSSGGDNQLLGELYNAYSDKFGSPVTENHPNEPVANKWGHWFHRDGERFAGRPASWGGGHWNTSAFQGFQERTYACYHDPFPGNPDLMIEQDALTVAEVNSLGFGIILQFKFPETPNPAGPTSITMHVDAVRICVQYQVWHSTGSC